ncbi:MAG TPA: toprim domain-containing protein [Vitreimonas sp.]|uniref:toprim domain-containing protein n=1 Tax=Vitreimonas sp. TaxID=3069702 RepID=UPI002D3CFE27|nr:toprim domain-containing protein [Vitreimonas sp.]HYD86790.1 toprim domain-containing protein [Vitreimonas sp.]
MSAPAKRLTEAQIDVARDVASISAVAERGGVIMDPRKSRPASGDYWALCPFHAEKTASLHIVERGAQSYFRCHGCGERGDVFALAQRLFRCSFLQAFEIVGGRLDAAPDPELIAARAERMRELEAQAEAERAARRAAAERIYCAAGLHVAGTLGDLYIKRTRTIAAPLGAADLRFYSRAPLSPYEPHKAGRCPAIVAGIRNAEGALIGAHMTFIKPDGSGKADLPHLDGSRLICGEHVGGHIRLGRVRDAAVIGEGWETTLSASEACALPGLAAINAPNLRALILPAGVKRAVIAFDRDPKGVGEMSAEALAQRLWSDGVRVEMLPPPDGFGDWNDAAQVGALPKLEAA